MCNRVINTIYCIYVTMIEYGIWYARITLHYYQCTFSIVQIVKYLMIDTGLHVERSANNISLLYLGTR